MKQIVFWIDLVINNHENEKILESVKRDVKSICERFKIYNH